MPHRSSDRSRHLPRPLVAPPVLLDAGEMAEAGAALRGQRRAGRGPRELLVLGHRELAPCLQQRLRAGAGRARRATGHRAGGEELRAASRAVGEERQLAVLEGRSLTLEQPGEREVEGGGVGVAALARQTERGLALRRPAALEALVHRGLSEALLLHLDQAAVRFVGHLRERRVIEEGREALEERAAALSVERRAIV